MNEKKIYINCYSRTERDRIAIPMQECHDNHFIGFKGMCSDMRCRGYQYELGENRITKELDKDAIYSDSRLAIYSDNRLYFKVPSSFISLCKRGLHFCWDLSSVFYYYPFYEEVPEEFGNRYCIVMTNGYIESNIEKACTDSLIVLEEIPRYMIKTYKDIYHDTLKFSDAKTQDAMIQAMKESGIHELVETTIDGFINFNSRGYKYEKIWT